MQGKEPNANWKRQLAELSKSLEGLTEEKEFAVVFFSSEEGERTGEIQAPYQVLEEPAKLYPATVANKARTIEWANNVIPSGGTNPTKAIDLVFRQLKPESLFFTTDGVFNKARRLMYSIPKDQIATLQRGRGNKMAISTVLFPPDPDFIKAGLDEPGVSRLEIEALASKSMKDIAIENSGEFKIVR